MLFKLGTAGSAVAVIAFLAGCASSGSGNALGLNPSLPASSNSYARRAPDALSDIARHPLRGSDNDVRVNFKLVDPDAVNIKLYVSNENDNYPSIVSGYRGYNKRNRKPLCQVNNLLQTPAIETDTTGNLWIPGIGPTGNNEVISYGPNCGAPGPTLTDPNGLTLDIAFSSNGDRYVSDCCINNHPGVSIYPKGKKVPSRRLSDLTPLGANYIGTDSKGDVFQGYLTVVGSNIVGGVIEYMRGKMPGHLLNLVSPFSSTIGFPGTIAFDKHDNLILIDQIYNSLNIYSPPYNGPPQWFPLRAHAPQCALNRIETKLACAGSQHAVVDVFAYPSGAYLYSFTKGLGPNDIGIARWPGPG